MDQARLDKRIARLYELTGIANLHGLLADFYSLDGMTVWYDIHLDDRIFNISFGTCVENIFVGKSETIANLLTLDDLQIWEVGVNECLYDPQEDEDNGR